MVPSSKALSRKRLQLAEQVLRDRGQVVAAVLFPVEQPELRERVVLVEKLRAGKVARPTGEALELRDRSEGLALCLEAFGKSSWSGFVRQPAGPEGGSQVTRQQLGHRLKQESRQVRPPGGFAGVEK